MTINPISSAHAQQISQPAARQPQPPPSESNAVPQDKVSLSNVGGTDHDGDSK